MATLGERITVVEGDVREQRVRTDGLHEALANLRQDMSAGFAAVDRRFDRIEQRFEAVDRRFEGVDRRFESMDRRFEGMDRRFDQLDAKVSRQFVWLVGVQVMTLAAVVTSLATILSAVGGR